VPPSKTAPVQKQTISRAKRERAFHSAKDYETSASQIGDIEPPSESIKNRARRVAAEQLVRREPDATAKDLAELLMMLGLHPSQPDWEEGPTLGPGRTFNAGI